MHPDLARCLRGLREGLAGISPAEAERPRGTKWSIAQIAEHLDLAYTRSAAGVARRLQKGAAPRRGRTVRQMLARFVVVQLGYFPSGRKAPDAVLPQGRPFSKVVAGLEPHLIELDERLQEAERVFGAAAPILDHPIIGPFSVADWRRFHWVHTRHHLKQLATRN